MPIHFYYALFFHYLSVGWLTKVRFQKVHKFLHFLPYYIYEFNRTHCMFLYRFLTQQLSSKGPNYVSRINLSNMAPKPPKMPRGATHYQVGKCTAAFLPSAIYSVTNDLYCKVFNPWKVYACNHIYLCYLLLFISLVTMTQTYPIMVHGKGWFF